MSSRNQLIGSISITILLVFSPGCWSLWLRASPAKDLAENMYNNNLLLDNEYLMGTNSLDAGVPYLQSKSKQRPYYSPQTSEDEWAQVMAFLHNTVENQKVQTVSSYLNKLLKENSDEYLPIVYEESVVSESSTAQTPVEDYENTPEVIEQQESYNDNNEDEHEKLNQLETDDNQQLVEYEINDQGEVRLHKEKRAGRYYRRYPWKRKNNRFYENPKYNCKPSRDEVVKLLIALHKYQNGSKDRRMVKFCKRDRPLGNIITNIRFLG